MSNVMSLKKLSNKPSRNGFDLSRKNIFSAKVGELLPVSCIECIPGDKFKINIKNFTRTMPVNTAAYTRIREYFDFFFVPTNLMWNKFNTFVTQMSDNNQNAESITASVALGDQHPYFTPRQWAEYYDKTITEVSTGTIDNSTNMFGYKRIQASQKLMNYLGYGRYEWISGSDTADVDSAFNSFPANPDIALNPFPLLAYQKIYADYYRNSQWEKAFAPAFNINYKN